MSAKKLTGLAVIAAVAAGVVYAYHKRWIFNAA